MGPVPLLLIGLLLAVGASPGVPPRTAVAQEFADVAAAPLEQTHPAAVVPQRARDVLALIRARHGQPPPGHIGGRVFQNRERHLPPGLYREYDVNAKQPGRPRDGERIVIEQQTGHAYYSGDHYRTFAPIE
jgi:ribonuclease T1